MSVGSLEFCDGIELRGRRFDGVLVMVVDGSKCLLLDRRRASVMVQNRVERRRVPRRWDTAKDSDVRRARVIRQRNPRRQRDAKGDGRVRLDPRRADSVVVERVVNQEPVVGVRLLDDPLHVGQAEGTRVACCGRSGTYARCRRTSPSRRASCR